MKRILFVAFASCLMSSVIAQDVLVSATVSTATEAEFSWDDGLSHDFGKIIQDEPASHKFVFTNTGSEPLVISSAKGSCGCTVTEFSQQPIAPGAQGMVMATYNAKKVGAFTKTVTVYANTSEPVILKVKGEVVASN